MANEDLNERVAETVKTNAADVETKPLDVKKHKAIASQSDSDKAKALEENIVEEPEEDSTDAVRNDANV